MSGNNKISVVTCTRNSAETIVRCIESVRGQTHKKVEHIIIDCLSNDGTAEIVSNYPEIKLISEKDNGIYDGFNKGIANSTGSIIHFLNSDDEYNSIDVLKKVDNLFIDQKLSVLFCRSRLTTNNYFFGQRNFPSIELSKKNLENCLMPPHPGAFMRKSILNILGGFDTCFNFAGDFELFIRLNETKDIIVGYSDFCSVNMYPGGATSSFLKNRVKISRELLKALKKNHYASSWFKVNSRFLKKFLLSFN